MKPLVAIVGRPNVGKSTLFNRLAGRRIAIVEDSPGVTRDRLYADCTWGQHAFTLIDTGGIDPYGESEIFTHMRRQAQAAIDLCDVILFLCDGQSGLSPDDRAVADMLRHARKPVLTVVNKVDRFPSNLHTDFYSLGLGEVHPISAANGLNLGDMLDAIIANFSPITETEENKSLKIAIVGRPNAGKSSIVNALCGEERVIVSALPGTTRDAVDTPLTADGKDYVLIDTAGIRRKARIERASIEQYSVLRALAAISRCDVAVLVIDACAGLAEQDQKIAGLILDAGKPCVIAVNKWDAVEKTTGTLEAYEKDLDRELKFISWARRVYISAIKGQRLKNLLPECEKAHAAASFRVPTGVLNDCIGEAVAITQPPPGPRGRVKIYFSTQASVCPPTFVIKVNQPEALHFSYLRYLENIIRKTFDFDGTPIKVIIRGREE
ncbi:MAG: ribosome biogenesis GTPase Der [Clostridia bacterium]|nr:ribosome biogenesis GTPase Der [Clostridia bacterium]